MVKIGFFLFNPKTMSGMLRSTTLHHDNVVVSCLICRSISIINTAVDKLYYIILVLNMLQAPSCTQALLSNPGSKTKSIANNRCVLARQFNQNLFHFVNVCVCLRVRAHMRKLSGVSELILLMSPFTGKHKE